MRIPRIFIEEKLAEGQHYQLPDAAAHHVAQVLRMKPGQLLNVFNGQGGQYEAVIHKINKHNVEFETVKYHNDNPESSLDITLVQGISRGERMDYTLQKAVELGVMRIAPVFCEYTNVKLDDTKKIKRHEHWQKIIINACEQSGRNRLPQLLPAQNLESWLQTEHVQLRLVLHPAGTTTLSRLSCPGNQLVLLSGPEGGFSDDEVMLSVKYHYQPVVLGPRILRTETAALAAISACQMLWGDFR